MMKEHIMITQHGFRAKLKSRQHGAVAIIVAICLTLLIGMIGLVVDLGHMFIIKTELQNAADSCALAAARELDGTAESLERAEKTGITVGQRNNVDLQK
jgi:Flp pilus assembly protein TadG